MKLASIQLGENLFGVYKSEFPMLLKKQAHLMHLKTLYSLYERVIQYINDCYNIPWAKVNIQKINEDILQFVIE